MIKKRYVQSFLLCLTLTISMSCCNHSVSDSSSGNTVENYTGISDSITDSTENSVESKAFDKEPSNDSSHVDSADNSINNEESFKMTEEHKNFLIDNLMDEKEIRDGNLKEWQIKLLKKYDFCKNYLSDKYQAHTFEITTYDSSNPSFIKFIVVPDGDEESVFTVNVFEDNDQMKATDTFK